MSINQMVHRSAVSSSTSMASASCPQKAWPTCSGALLGEPIRQFEHSRGHVRWMVQARYGGQLRLDLRSSPESGRFRFTWIDLVASREVRSGDVNGGAIRTFHAPEDYPANLNYKDWLLDLRASPGH